MSVRSGKIEISFPVELRASLAFWVDRAEWRAMTKGQRDERMLVMLEGLSLLLHYGPIPFDGGDLCAELASEHVTTWAEYDPEEDE